jgi:hypothetical protein
MSDVNPNDTKIIADADDVRHLYTGAGKNAKTGLEVELAFINPNAPDLTPMTVPQNRVVKNAANAALQDETGLEWVRNEPTSETLEAAGIPAYPHELQKILDDAAAKIKTLTQKAANIGLKRSYFAELPDKTALQLLSSIVPVPRYQAFFNPPREDMLGIAAYFSVCKSNQVSVSHRDSGHLFNNMRRFYFLAPYLFLLTDNSSGFNEGIKFSGHAGMHHRAALGARGGAAEYVFKAKNGEELIDLHINAVMNNPLYVYYNAAGELVRLPSGTWTSFNELRAQGLNTATNYFFAQTVLWPDVKIAAIKDSAENVTSHRFEARMFGVGIHQHQSALLITAGLAFNDDFAARTDRLLREFGFDSARPEESYQLLKKSYAAARQHNGRFLDIAYGTGTMIDFSKRFAELLEAAYLGSDFEESLAPIIMIARTGCTDAKINRLLFPTLEAAAEQQRRYDPTIFDAPNQCARMIYAQDIARSGRTAGCSSNAA